MIVLAEGLSTPNKPVISVGMAYSCLLLNSWTAVRLCVCVCVPCLSPFPLGDEGLRPRPCSEGRLKVLLREDARIITHFPSCPSYLQSIWGIVMAFQSASCSESLVLVHTKGGSAAVRLDAGLNWHVGPLWRQSLCGLVHKASAWVRFLTCSDWGSALKHWDGKALYIFNINIKPW